MFGLKYRNFELTRKGKRYPLYIFLPSGGSGDCVGVSGVCTGIVGTMFMCICHLYLKHLEHVSRYLGQGTWVCAGTVGIVQGHLGIVLGYLGLCWDTWGLCWDTWGLFVLWYLAQ
jgi:hypothetical protein